MSPNRPRAVVETRWTILSWLVFWHICFSDHFHLGFNNFSSENRVETKACILASNSRNTPPIHELNMHDVSIFVFCFRKTSKLSGQNFCTELRSFTLLRFSQMYRKIDRGAYSHYGSRSRTVELFYSICMHISAAAENGPRKPISSL